MPGQASPDVVLNFLNKHGGIGWELIHIRERNIRVNNLEQKRLYFIMKRPKGQIDIRDLTTLPET